eukprot:15439974-Alexandrium_andersonii.AAC.1
MHPCPKSFPLYLHQCVGPSCLCATLIIITACSRESPELACIRTPAPPASGLMSGGRVATYENAPGLGSS